jgi:hypothetical protein
MRKLMVGVPLGCIIALNAFSASMYVCQDPKTGKKYGQASPCLTGHDQIRMYKGAGSADTTKVVAINQQVSGNAHTSTQSTPQQGVGK